ncbi:MAG: GNAT family N-acetyltransferase [Rubrivivax sp.]|nr:GNAT family N-acetyltransferase [Rubrivivax sp.]
MEALAVQRIWPALRKARRLRGHALALRNAVAGDAAFIHAQRTDARNAEHLSPTSARLADQVAWMQRYAQDDSQAYFVIESLDGLPLGTVRLYDAQEGSFCWGSWILSASAAPTAAMESALIVYRYALDELGFNASHFQVNLGNTSVCRFHEQFFGARRVAQDDTEIHFVATEAALRAALKRWSRFLPAGIVVET